MGKEQLINVSFPLGMLFENMAQKCKDEIAMDLIGKPISVKDHQVGVICHVDSKKDTVYGKIDRSTVDDIWEEFFESYEVKEESK